MRRGNLEKLEKIVRQGPAKAKSLNDQGVTFDMLMGEMVGIDGDFSRNKTLNEFIQIDTSSISWS